MTNVRVPPTPGKRPAVTSPRITAQPGRYRVFIHRARSSFTNVDPSTLGRKNGEGRWGKSSFSITLYVPLFVPPRDGPWTNNSRRVSRIGGGVYRHRGSRRYRKTALPLTSRTRFKRHEGVAVNRTTAVYGPNRGKIFEFFFLFSPYRPRTRVTEKKL